jgi:hypothetical protein
MEKAIEMQEPPRLSGIAVPAAHVEVLPPILARAGELGLQAGSVALPGTELRESGIGRPIHPLSALLLVAVDSLWAVFEFAPPLWIVAIPACFAAVFVPTYLIQKHLKQDSPGKALAFATLLGVLAAVPTPITGTPVGLGLLAWTGLGKLFTRTPKP